MTDTVSKTRVARCCCGSLEVEAKGDPIQVAICSCEQCQRRTGSAFGISTYWMRSEVTIRGATKMFVREGQEGRELSFYFCPNCGSTVYWENPERRPGGIGIAGGTFADPDFPPPKYSVWERTKHTWISIPAEEHFPQNPPPPPQR